jgi:hypothetical protein
MQSVIAARHVEVVLEQSFEENIWTGETRSRGGGVEDNEFSGLICAL